MLFELQFPNTVGPSVYRQHQHVDAVMWGTQPDQHWRTRDYIWCESDGVFFVRRPVPTNDLSWQPVIMPPQDSMLTIQVQARCRHSFRGERRGTNHPTIKRGARQTLIEPGECMAWLAMTTQRMGLRLEDAEVTPAYRSIDRFVRLPRPGYDPKPGRQFTLASAYFTAVVQVTDVACFEAALTNGIGDSKAFGCGYIHFWQRGQ